MAKARYEIRHVCGCLTRREITWDARRRQVEEFEPHPARPGSLRSQPSLVSPRRAAELVAERGDPPGEPCLKCTLEARRAAIAAEVPALAADPWLHLPAVRAVRRVAAVTGGAVSRSPKSSSLYVTWAGGAWRISNHPWPGRRESLLSEHPVGCFFAARLTPDWLTHERKSI